MSVHLALASFVYMNNTTLLRSLLFFLAFVTATAPYIHSQPQADTAAAEAFLKQWDNAWGAHNAHALALLHTQDAITVNRFGTLIKGRSDTEKALAFLHSHDGPFGQSKFPPMKLLAARNIATGVMVVQAGWQNPIMYPNGKTDPVKVNDMIVTFVLVKEGTTWRASEIDPHNIEKMDLPYSNPGQKN